MSWYSTIALALGALVAALAWLAFEIYVAVVRYGWTETVDALTTAFRIG